jgi:hypothetical protein
MWGQSPPLPLSPKICGTLLGSRTTDTPEKMRVCPHHTLKAAVADGLIPRKAAAGLKLPRITREEIDP